MKRSGPIQRRTPLRATAPAKTSVPRALIVHKPLARPPNYAVVTLTAAQPKPQACKPGKRSPTVAERQWMDDITAIGCIACLTEGHEGTPGAVHHLLRGGRRIGHLFTICLCDPGHHQNGQQHGKVSRHPDKSRFEALYGTEAELLELTQQLVQQRKGRA